MVKSNVKCDSEKLSNGLFAKKVCYVGSVINSKSDIKGPYLCHYHILNELKFQNPNVESVDTSETSLIKFIKSLIYSDIIWLTYPIRRYIAFVIIPIILFFNKELILQIYDLPVEQSKDLRAHQKSTIFKVQLKSIEKVLVWKAKTIILSSPGYIDYIKPHNSNIIVFPHGISEDLLISKFNVHKKQYNKYILAYAGGLDRGGMIEKISSIFSEIDDWEFWIAGEGGEHIAENENTHYFGFLPHSQVSDFYENADAIIIPYPNKEYYRICIPLKIGEVLATCKPIIMVKLPSIEKYLKFVGLESNVIFVEDWTINQIEIALKKAETHTINVQETLNKLELISWERRVKILFDVINQKCQNHFYLELDEWI